MSGGGVTYFLFMLVSSGSFLNSVVLTSSYVLSPRSRTMIRPTMFVSFFYQRARFDYTRRWHSIEVAFTILIQLPWV